MRKHSALRSPQPRGWGFSFGGAVIAVSLLFAVPAHAANVGVSLDIAAGGKAGVVKTCSVSVSFGASGASVLSAARTSGCIRSFELSHANDFVTCLDPGLVPADPAGASNLCQIQDGLVTFWAYYKNNATQTAGIDAFDAHSGDVLTLAYTNFAGCPTYPDCPL